MFNPVDKTTFDVRKSSITEYQESDVGALKKQKMIGARCSDEFGFVRLVFTSLSLQYKEERTVVSIGTWEAEQSTHGRLPARG